MRHNCWQKMRHENVCNLSWSKPNTDSHACVCVRSGSLGAWVSTVEVGEGGLANCCNAHGNIAVIVCTCQRGFPFPIFPSPFYGLCFFLIARIFAFCILHELNSSTGELRRRRSAEEGRGVGQPVAVSAPTF